MENISKLAIILVVFSAVFVFVLPVRAGVLPDFCQCSSGLCCDGCYFRPQSFTCGFENKTEYGCPWGTGCGSDVGITSLSRLHYCPGNSANCTGAWSNWQIQGNWGVYKNCSSTQACSLSSLSCQTATSCASPQPSPQPVPAACGDNICGPQENNENCPQDCKANQLIISVFGKKEDSSLQWQKEFGALAGDKIYFFLSVKNDSSTQVSDITVKVDLPQEITYTGNLKVNDIPTIGDVISGFVIGALDTNNSKSITFEAAVAPSAAPAKKQITVSTYSGVLYNSDVVTIDLAAVQGAAAVSQPRAGLSIRAFLERWYIWILASIVAAFLFVMIFRRLSKNY